MSQSKTYRGAELEELLAQIRTDLGADAVVTRLREGVVGGIGGFFGKRCLEIEAHAGENAAAAQAAVDFIPPSRPFSLVNFYDTGEAPEPATLLPAEEEDDLAFLPVEAAVFAEEEEPHAAPFVAESFETQLPAPQAPFADPFSDRLDDAIYRLDSSLDSGASVRATLVLAGVPERIAGAVVAEAEQHLAPFSPDEPLVAHARRVLARRIPVRRSVREGQRVIAVVGATGSGRTSAVAALCRAYARSGTRVAALSLEGVREVLAITDAIDCATRLEVAATPDVLSIVREELQDVELVVADTPPLDPRDPRSVARLAALLDVLQPTETHLVVPGREADSARLLLDAVGTRIRPNRLLVTRVDEQDSGRCVGLAIARRLPFSYVRDTAGLRPADPTELARLVLR